jgi:hypothetical protein
MAGAVTPIVGVQLSILQSPEIAREQEALALQTQSATIYAPALIAKHDQLAAETVQMLQRVDRHGVPDALAGDHNHDHADRRPSAGRRSSDGKTVALAATHPRGLGALVDVSA